MRLLYTALLGPSVLIVMVESYCASKSPALSYSHAYRPFEGSHLPSSPALAASVRYGGQILGKRGHTKPVMERAPPWIVLRPYRFGRFDDGMCCGWRYEMSAARGKSSDTYMKSSLRSSQDISFVMDETWQSCCEKKQGKISLLEFSMQLYFSDCAIARPY